MANASQQQIGLLETWLSDTTGPAKLSKRQQELLASMNETTKSEAGHLVVVEEKNLAINGDKQLSNNNVQNMNKLTDSLRLNWRPDEILEMFYEERQKIIARGKECKTLLLNADSVLNEVLALQDLCIYVSPRTSQLHLECKNIIQERNDLRESFDKINSTLNRKEELRSIFRRMPDIKNQIVSILNLVCQNYQTRLEQQQQQLDGTPLDEYYGRFFIECRRIKELTSQLESCLSSSNTEELLSHLEEIYMVYFDIREQLIGPIFSKNLKTFVAKADRNYCDLLRQTSSWLVQTLRNEILLFNQIFPSPANQHQNQNSSQTQTSKSQSKPDSPSQSQQQQSTGDEHPIKKQVINQFLDLLCRTYYEHLRPVVIRLNHLETLAELYKLIVESIKLEIQEDCFQGIMSNLAEDIQERMVFRAEVFFQERVLDYKPSSGDLAYPEKLEILSSGGQLKDFQSMWYPTVQRTVLALFYLNRVLDRLTFSELAYEAVIACYKSLDIAQNLIDERHGGTKLEATLFLTKHLAIIQDQLQSYGIEQIPYDEALQPKGSSII